MSAAMQGPGDAGTLRLDKWLWHARFFKSRTQAAAFCAEGRLRLNRRHIDRAHAPVRVGDVLTFALGKLVRVVQVRALGARRGSPAEARQLYRDLAPPEPSAGMRHASRDADTTDLLSEAARST